MYGTTATLSTMVMLPFLLWFETPVQDTGSPVPQPPSSAAPRGLDQQLLDGLEPAPAEDAGSSAASAAETPDAEAPRQRAEDASIAGSDIGTRNPLAGIEQQMRFVEQRLRERALAEETQQAQQEIVASLDVLIATLSDAMQTQASPSSQQRSQAEEPTETAGNEPARDAAGGTGDEASAAATGPPVVMRRAADQIWGHLPERLRRQMQSAEGIEFLPQYRQLIEDYYKRLAGER